MSAPLDQKMTAAEYVALAKRAAHEWLNEARAYLPSVNARHAPFGLNVLDNVLSTFDYASSLSPRALMFARVAPETTASESALVRALLASAVTVKPSGFGHPPYANFHASMPDGSCSTYARTADEGRDHILDALLAPALDHGDA